MSKYLNQDSTFIDIGGNMGIYSLMAAKFINQTGRILSFEPNPTMIELYQFGIADKESTFSLELSKNNLGRASIVNAYGEGNIMIKCRPLLAVLREQNIKQIHLLKIDIENAEPLALNPFFEKAPRELYPKMIFIESDEGINLKRLGYKIITKTRSHNTILVLE